MTAFQNKRFSVTTSGLDPNFCRHERVVDGACKYCGARVNVAMRCAHCGRPAPANAMEHGWRCPCGHASITKR